MNAPADIPLLYTELADWWPVLSAPGDYAEEAEFYRQAMISAANLNIRTVVEFGSGGGNNASHLKEHFEMILVDRSPGMLSVSKKLNPECDHLEGDMRTARLGRQFDAVFIHDAIVYMTTEGDPAALLYLPRITHGRRSNRVQAMAVMTGHTGRCATWSGPGIPIRWIPLTTP
jgi:SAM-dependent methyltransferase